VGGGNNQKGHMTLTEAYEILGKREGTMTLTEAFDILSHSLVGAYQIKMECWNHGDGPKVTWTIWDGTVHHEDKELGVAVRKAHDANHPPSPNVVLEKAEAALKG